LLSVSPHLIPVPPPKAENVATPLLTGSSAQTSPIGSDLPLLRLRVLSTCACACSCSLSSANVQCPILLQWHGSLAVARLRSALGKQVASLSCVCFCANNLPIRPYLLSNSQIFDAKLVSTCVTITEYHEFLGIFSSEHYKMLMLTLYKICVQCSILEFPGQETHQSGGRNFTTVIVVSSRQRV